MASAFPVDDSGRSWEDPKALQHICELTASRSSTGCQGTTRERLMPML